MVILVIFYHQIQTSQHIPHSSNKLYFEAKIIIQQGKAGYIGTSLPSNTYEPILHSVNQFYFEVKIIQQGDDGYIGNYLLSNIKTTFFCNYANLYLYAYILL